jgi:Zn-finger nucleic acid-binding protein
VPRQIVECLRCGARHELVRSPWRQLQSGHCPRCGYVGWADTGALDEPARKVLRERSSEGRRVRPVY